MRSAAPAKLRLGKASRKAVMNAFTSARPRRGSCSEYCKRMSGAASSSTMLGFHVSPQNSVNQRPTMALLSCSLDMLHPFASPVLKSPADGDMLAGRKRTSRWREYDPGSQPKLCFLRSKPNSDAVAPAAIPQQETECSLTP